MTAVTGVCETWELVNLFENKARNPKNQWKMQQRILIGRKRSTQTGKHVKRKRND